MSKSQDSIACFAAIVRVSGLPRPMPIQVICFIRDNLLFVGYISLRKKSFAMDNTVLISCSV